jgi:hypothetical protein
MKLEKKIDKMMNSAAAKMFHFWLQKIYKDAGERRLLSPS